MLNLGAEPLLYHRKPYAKPMCFHTPYTPLRVSAPLGAGAHLMKWDLRGKKKGGAPNRSRKRSKSMAGYNVQIAIVVPRAVSGLRLERRSWQIASPNIIWGITNLLTKGNVFDG